MRVLDLGKCAEVPQPSAKECKGRAVWADFSEEEAREGLASFGIPLDAFERLEEAEYPSYEELEDWTGVVFIGLDYKEGIKKRRMYAFFNERMLVTVGADEILASFIKTAMEKRMRAVKKEIIIVYILQELTKKFEYLVDRLEDEVEVIEERVIKEVGSDAIVTLLDLKRALLLANKVFWHTREFAFDLKVHRVKFLKVDEMLGHALDDINHALIYLIDLNATYRDVLTDSLSVYHTAISNRINEKIKKLTAITILLTILATASVVPNTVATIFGIPYFPIQSDKALATLAGFSVFSWHIIVLVIFLTTVIPAIWMLRWWQSLKPEAEE
ncbi:MAG: CorA family divalent cation transporter [Candidatus Micrarchaeia archaeon]